MTIYTSKRVILKARPETTPKQEQLGTDEVQINDVTDLKEGEILVKTRYLSIDPYLLLAMGRKGVHADAIPNQKKLPLKQFANGTIIVNINYVFGGRGVGTVISSKHNDFQVGDLVASDYSWQEYAIINVDNDTTLEKLENEIFDKVSPLTSMGVLCVSGSHALWSFNYVYPRENPQGKTIVVSVATGNIGLIVCQLAKTKGLHVIDIAGGNDKCQRLLNEFKLDAVVDYRIANGNVEKLSEMIKEFAPNGVDAYFDNVDGTVTNAVYNNLNTNARAYFCGAVSQYGDSVRVHVLELYKNNNSITCIDCSQADYIDRIPEARRELFDLIQKGQLKPVEWITKGIENTPRVFEEPNRMYAGKNFGKTLVEI
ncbi:hypothetical protein ABK040_007025 [Willaertia magna]